MDSVGQDLVLRSRDWPWPWGSSPWPWFLAVRCPWHVRLGLRFMSMLTTLYV